MKKKIVVVLSLIMIAVLAVTGCAPKAAAPAAAEPATDTAAAPAAEAAAPAAATKVAMVLPGLKTDEAFNQYTYEGMMRAQKELGIETAFREEVKQDEQVTLANAERSTYYAALSGQDPVEYANKLVSHMNKSRKIHTRYGTIVDRNSYEATGRQAVRDRKAGKISDAEWLNIQESMKMARDLQNF